MFPMAAFPFSCPNADLPQSPPAQPVRSRNMKQTGEIRLNIGHFMRREAKHKADLDWPSYLAHHQEANSQYVAM